MTERINRETGCRYAKFDGSIVNGDTRSTRGAKWVRVWIHLLNMKDQEAAELVQVRNNTSDECLGGAHDDCYFLWCKCLHHSAVQFRVEHPQLKSLSEVQSEAKALAEDSFSRIERSIEAQEAFARR